jgi:toxin ParE1/3/4
MAEYVLTKKAVADLAGIWEYTADVWSEAQADKYYTTIINACQELADNPQMGRAYISIAANISGFRVQRHIIFYRAGAKKAGASIEVIRILHEKMDLRNRILED